MVRLRRIGVLFFAKLNAIAMAMIGLIAGILYSFGGLIYELSTDTINDGTALAFLALFGMPLAFSAVGFVVGTIEAVLYNVFARIHRGIELDFEPSP